MKIISIIAFLCLSICGSAAVGALPQDDEELVTHVIPQTTCAGVGVILEAERGNEIGYHVLNVKMRVDRFIFGNLSNAVFHATYRELMLRASYDTNFPPANYTGSAHEWWVHTNDVCVFFLSYKTNGLSLLRLERAEREGAIAKLFRKPR